MNMGIDKKLRIAFVIISISLLWSLLRLDIQRSKHEKLNNKVVELTKSVDSLQNLSDSLSMELFPKEIELNRYEIAYKIFLERNPKAASQYGDIISEETE